MPNVHTSDPKSRNKSKGNMKSLEYVISGSMREDNFAVLIKVLNNKTKVHCQLKVNMDHTWIGTLNICRGISSLSFWVNALPTAYA